MQSKKESTTIKHTALGWNGAEAFWIRTALLDTLLCCWIQTKKITTPNASVEPHYSLRSPNQQDSKAGFRYQNILTKHKAKSFTFKRVFCMYVYTTYFYANGNTFCWSVKPGIRSYAAVNRELLHVHLKMLFCIFTLNKKDEIDACFVEGERFVKNLLQVRVVILLAVFNPHALHQN